MPINILMPALSPTMEQGNLAKWLKKEGDAVEAGEVIAEIETDKATMEVEAVDEGVIGKILTPTGSQEVPVNSIIAILLEEGEDQATLTKHLAGISKKSESSVEEVVANKVKPAEKEKLEKDLKEEVKSKLKLAKTKPAKNQKDAVTTLSSEDKEITASSANRVYASPLAKTIAKNENIDIITIKDGTGPRGRVIKIDILNYLATKQREQSSKIKRNNPGYKLITNNNIRQIIAKKLTDSKQTIPHFYLTIECKMTNLLAMRQEINMAFERDKKRKISVNDFVIMATAKALKEVPAANASWGESAIKQYSNVDIAVAVAIKEGLITPILKNTDQKTIEEISIEMKELAQKARNNVLKPEEFQGGSFTISNLGMYGIKNFKAIINPPQSCILAIGASTQRAIVVNKQLQIGEVMDVTLSCDHRVVDGAVGALFLQAFQKYMEAPILLFI